MKCSQFMKRLPRNREIKIPPGCPVVIPTLGDVRILTVGLWPLERRTSDVPQKAGNEGADIKFARAVAYLLEGGYVAMPAVREALLAMHREHSNKGLDNGTLLSILSGSIGHVDHDSLQETFDRGFEAGAWRDLHAYDRARGPTPRAVGGPAQSSCSGHPTQTG